MLLAALRTSSLKQCLNLKTASKFVRNLNWVLRLRPAPPDIFSLNILGSIPTHLQLTAIRISYLYICSNLKTASENIANLNVKLISSAGPSSNKQFAPH